MSLGRCRFRYESLLLGFVGQTPVIESLIARHYKKKVCVCVCDNVCFVRVLGDGDESVRIVDV